MMMGSNIVDDGYIMKKVMKSPDHYKGTCRFVVRYKTYSLMLDIAVLMYFFPNGTISLNTERPHNKVDVTIHIEYVYPEFAEASEVNILVVNHEYFGMTNNIRSLIKSLDSVDYIFLKTKIACDMFEKAGLTNKIIYTKFTSPIYKHPGSIMRYDNGVLHFAGGYKWKQTDSIINAWMSHPELPMLYVLCHSMCKDNVEAYTGRRIDDVRKCKNITFFADPISDDVLYHYKNIVGIHLCPSMVEGYGHYINESRGLGAFVVTTNHPPMNELITNDSGYLIECTETIDKPRVKFPVKLCIVSPESIYVSIRRVVSLPYSTLKKCGNRAMKMYHDDKTYLGNTVTSIIQEINGR